MRVLKLLFYSFIFNNFLMSLAIASNDINYCNFSLSLVNKQNDTCSNLPFLTPFNDSRTNLILLIDNKNTQKITLNSLSSPQNKAPYLANDIRKNIAKIPFELTIYNAYLDEIAHTHKNKIKQLKTNINEKTKKFILHVMKNDSLLNNDDFLSSPALLFIEQIAITPGLNEQERKNLLFARYLLFDNPQADISSFIPINPSFIARHFINYLQGTSAFYKKDYDKALKYFSEASTASQFWVKETATYMVARTLLNKGQSSAYNNWYELDFKKVDQVTINQSYRAFNNYLKKYPKGKYTNSANALLRRVYWLQDNRFALAKSYEQLLNDFKSSSQANIVLEIDNKIYFNNQFKAAHSLYKSPKLLAVYDLLKMRSNQLSKIDLDNQKSVFKNNPALYVYLQATYYTYIDPNPEQVLLLVPQLVTPDKKSTTITSVQFSSQILRAIALENTYRWLAAETLWKDLKEIAKQSYQLPLIELGLALNYEKTNRVDNVFDKNSPITTAQLRYILLRKNANQEQLKELILKDNIALTDKASIIYLLLYKDLLSQQYDDFLTDSSLLITGYKLDETKLENITRLGKNNLTLFSEAIPSHPNYPCPSPIILANVLKLNPKDAKALNCLGEFSKHYQLPYTRYILASSQNTGALGSNNPTDFGKYLYSRLKGYQFIINDNTASDDDRAYALYNAIRCFIGTGYNQCDKQNISQTNRKEWFQLLHTKYAKTSWAKQQPIYW